VKLAKVKRKAYALAGVDVDLGNRLKGGIHGIVRKTHGPQVLGRIGGFGGLFRVSFKSMRDRFWCPASTASAPN
jgi:phosphoribosylformylglycinamidine cyclo-ligase